MNELNEFKSKTQIFLLTILHEIHTWETFLKYFCEQLQVNFFAQKNVLECKNQESRSRLNELFLTCKSQKNLKKLKDFVCFYVPFDKLNVIECCGGPDKKFFCC